MPKYEYKTLANIDDRINRVISKLDIQVDHPVSDAIIKRQNFYIIKSDYQNQEIIFKARIADHRILKQWYKNFRNERRFLRTLTKDYPHHPIHLRLPKYINSQVYNPEWLLYGYVPGRLASPSCLYYPQPTKPQILKIIHLLLDIQNFPIQEFCQKYSWTKNIIHMDFYRYHEFFHKIIRQRKKDLLTVLTEEMIMRADQILVKHRHLLDKHCTLLAHGDFHPSNIIINKVAKAIDWEQLHIDNAAYDVAYLWFRMVNNCSNRRFLITEFMKWTKQKKDISRLFRLNLLARLPDEISTRINIIKQFTPGSFKYRRAQKAIKLYRKNFISALNNEELQNYD